jgi:hypothetical protein
MTQKKDKLISRLLNLRGDETTDPSEFLKYSMQQIYHFIEVEEEKLAQPPIPVEDACQEIPKKRSAFDDFFGWGR